MNSNQEITQRFLNDFNPHLFSYISDLIVSVQYEPESVSSEEEVLEMIGNTLKETVFDSLEKNMLFVDDYESQYFFEEEDYSCLQFIVKTGEYKLVIEYVFLHAVHIEGYSKAWMEMDNYVVLNRTTPY